MHDTARMQQEQQTTPRAFYSFLPANDVGKVTEYVLFGNRPFVRTADGHWRVVDSADVAGAVELDD